MTRYQTGTLENVIRTIVLDVMAERFSAEKTSPVNTSKSYEEITSGAEDNSRFGGPIKRNKKPAAKGRVTDPSKDRRLKQNRDQK